MTRPSVLRFPGAKSLHSYNPIPGASLYLPLWHPGLGGSVYRSADSFGITMTRTGATHTPPEYTVYDGDDRELIGVQGSAVSRITDDTAGTIMAWVYPTTLDGSHDILAYGQENVANPGNLSLRLAEDTGNWYATIAQNKLSTSEVSDVVRGGTVLSTNTWYFIAWTGDGSAYQLFINGVVETPTIVGGGNSGDWFADTENSAADTLSIGSLLFDGTYAAFLMGRLGDLALYDRVLTATEILYWYNQTKGRFV